MTGARAIRRQHQNVADRPFIVIWESTRACSPACLHCRAGAVPDRDPRELDTAAAKRLLGQAAAFGQPAPLFVITGGAPFRRPDLNELIAHGEEAGVRVAVSPSGTPTLTPSGCGRCTRPVPSDSRSARTAPPPNCTTASEGCPACTGGRSTRGTPPAPSA